MNIRLLVLETLLEEQKGHQSNLLMKAVLDKYGALPLQVRAFYRRLTTGTIEYRLQLDEILDEVSRVKTRKMKPVIREILRMSLYQIFYMNAVPDSAAVNEAVRLAEKKGFHSLKGFVNGVLRAVVRQKDSLLKKSDSNPIQDLSFRTSMPEFLIQKWTAYLGFEETEKLCQDFLKERPLSVRVRRKDPEAVFHALVERGISARQNAFLPDVLLLQKAGDLTRLPEFQEGTLYIQDPAGEIALQAVSREGMKEDALILDLCAAPGGKSILAADLFRKAMIHARDLSPARLLRMEENLSRCHLPNIRIEERDAREEDPDFLEKADLVIADVPCSGYGDIGRKPEIRYRASAQQEEELVLLQREILEQAVSMLKPGGTLLFSTCTINPLENEENVRWLKENFPLEGTDLSESLSGLHLPKGGASLKDGYVQILPRSIPGIVSDGFFFAILKKK